MYINECDCVTVLKQRSNHSHSNIRCLESNTNGGERRTGLGDKRRCQVQIPSLYKSVDVVQFLHLKITFGKLCFQSLFDKRRRLCSLNIVICDVHHDAKQMKKFSPVYASVNSTQ